MHDQAPDHVAAIPIRIHEQGDLPIYLQIRHQLSYLISSERLASGARLPAVRALAEELAISPHTVAKAYQDLQQAGLIESQAGRGSFVRTFGASDREQARRDSLLSDALRQARARARALGFSDEDTTRRLSTLVSQESCRAHVVFVDARAHIAEKYARRLEHHLPTLVEATGLTPDAIEAGTPEARSALDTAYYVLAFARTIPVVETSLQEGRFEIRTISSEVTPTTVRMLANLPGELRAVILTEERYIHATLNLIATYSNLDAARVDVFTPAAVGKFVRAAQESDLAFYTFSVGELIRAQPIDVPIRELAFDVSRDSLEKVHRLLNPEAQLAPA